MLFIYTVASHKVVVHFKISHFVRDDSCRVLMSFRADRPCENYLHGSSALTTNGMAH
jgi:hypothetical protein